MCKELSGFEGRIITSLMWIFAINMCLKKSITYYHVRDKFIVEIHTNDVIVEPLRLNNSSHVEDKDIIFISFLLLSTRAIDCIHRV